MLIKFKLSLLIIIFLLELKKLSNFNGLFIKKSSFKNIKCSDNPGIKCIYVSIISATLQGNKSCFSLGKISFWSTKVILSLYLSLNQLGILSSIGVFITI